MANGDDCDDDDGGDVHLEAPAEPSLFGEHDGSGADDGGENLFRQIEMAYAEELGAGKRPGGGGGGRLTHRGRRLSEPSSQSAPVTERRAVKPSTRHSVPLGKPSNRSEAAELASALNSRLEGSRSFRSEMEVYAQVFKEVSEQVAVHCAERGVVMERLRHFYTRSTDVTRRAAEKGLRAEMAALRAGYEEQVRALKEENEHLRSRQVGDDNERVVMDFFRELEPRKRQRVLGVLYAEAGKLLMRQEGGDELQTASEQAATLNHLLLQHTAEMRNEVLTSLMAIGTLPVQVGLLRRLLYAVPMAEQIRIAMDVLGPEQHTRIMLGIVESIAMPSAKATLLLEALHAMPPEPMAETLAHVVHGLGAKEQQEYMRLALEMMGNDEAAGLLAAVLSTLPNAPAMRAVTQWARGTQASGGTETVRSLLSALVSLVDDEQKKGAITQLCAGLAPDVRRATLAAALSNACDADDLRAIIPSALHADTHNTILTSPEVHAAIGESLSRMGAAGTACVARIYSGLGVDGRCGVLSELAGLDRFSAEECKVMLEYLVSVCGFSVRKFAESWSRGHGVPTGKVVKRKARKEQALELIELDQLSRLLADLIAKNAREDISNDRQGKPRPGLNVFMREYLFRQYAFKRVAEKVDRDLRHTVSQLAATSPAGSRMAMISCILGTPDKFPWAEAKSDFYLSFLVRALAIDAVAAKAPLGAAAGELTLSKREEAGPPNARNVLSKERAMVRLVAVEAALEHFVRSDELRAELLEAVSGEATDRVADEAVAHGSARAGEKMVDLDDCVMRHVMERWQASSERRTKALEARLEACFEEIDENGNGTLEYGEFRVLAARASPRIEQDEVLTMFDQGIRLSSEVTGEEMDAITREAFVEIAVEFGLVTFSEPDFRSPSELTTRPAPRADASPDLKRARAGSPGGPPSKGPALPVWSRRRSFVPSSNAPDADGSMKSNAEPKDSRVQGIIEASCGRCFLFRHLFSSASRALVDEVVGLFEIQTYEAGEVIIKQGSRGDFFYVVESGELDVLVDGLEVSTYAASEADNQHPCFGELALMYAKPRAASVVGRVAGTLWRLGRAGFRLAQTLPTSGGHSGQDLTRVLSKVDVFSSLRFDQLQALRDALIESTHAEGDDVFRQGDVGDAFYVVVRGQASVLKADGAGEREMMVLDESTYFGERALLHDEPRAATVRASGGAPLVVASITRPDFEKILGPLETLIEADRVRREAAQAAQQRQLEVFGLADATRASFALAEIVSPLPCGGLYTCRHVDADKAEGKAGDKAEKLYTLRQEVKAALVEKGERERLHRELALLSGLADTASRISSLPTLLRAFETIGGAISGSGSVYLLFGERAACELSALLDDGPLPEPSARFVGACIAQALGVLHADAQLLYRNVSIDSLHVLENGYVCLMDLHLAKRNDGGCRTLCGSVGSFSPEMVRGEPQTAAVDWWALGALLYELLMGELPWGSDGEEDTVYLDRISSHTAGGILMGEAASPHCQQLINGLLHPEADKRLGAPAVGGPDAEPGASGGFTQVKEDAWFSEIKWALLAEGELPSPLLSAAQELQAARASSAPPEELPEPPLETNEAWLDAVTHSTG